jgi:hypothetical protein
MENAKYTDEDLLAFGSFILDEIKANPKQIQNAIKNFKLFKQTMAIGRTLENAISDDELLKKHEQELHIRNMRDAMRKQMEAHEHKMYEAKCATRNKEPYFKNFETGEIKYLP